MTTVHPRPRELEESQPSNGALPRAGDRVCQLRKPACCVRQCSDTVRLPHPHRPTIRHAKRALKMLFRSMLADLWQHRAASGLHAKGRTLTVTLTRTCAARATEPRRATYATGFKLLAPKASATGLFARSCAADKQAMRKQTRARSMQQQSWSGYEVIRGYGCRCRTDNSCQAQGQGQGSALDGQQSTSYLAAGVVRGAVQLPPGRR